MAPSVSRLQQKAMFAAKAGKSTLGIPKKVGAEFIAADKAAGNTFKGSKKKMAVGRSKAV